MKNIEFTSSVSKRIYIDYLNRAEKQVSILSKDDKLDVLMEINSHIYEGVNKSNEVDEADRLLNVLENLGDPVDYLKNIVADKKINEATRTFNPKTIYEALRLNIKNGVIYSVFGVLYLFLFVFLILIVAKVIFPLNTGLFMVDQHFKGFGYIPNTTGMSEILGYWFIPIVAFLALVLYFLITLLLRLIRKK